MLRLISTKWAGPCQLEVLVQTADNKLSQMVIGVGSIGVDFIEMGSGIAMGNAGSDTYTGNGDSGIINELGHVTIDDDLELPDLDEAGDTVLFESVNSIDELTFVRTKILGEKRTVLKLVTETSVLSSCSTSTTTSSNSVGPSSS